MQKCGTNMEQTWNERGTNMEQRGTNVKRTWNKRGTNVEVLIYLIKNKSCRKQIIRKYLIKLNRILKVLNYLYWM